MKQKKDKTSFAKRAKAGFTRLGLALSLTGIVLLGTTGYVGSSVIAAISNDMQGCDGGSIVEIALNEYEQGQKDGTNNAGGQKYWSEFGFSGRVEWCGCFVGYCAKNAGLIPGETMPDWPAWAANWAAFYDQNKDAGSVHANDGKYEPKPGAIAVNGAIDAGWSQHVGIVEKCENGLVYTIEGNSGDATARCVYTLGSVWKYFSEPNYSDGHGGCSGTVINIPEEYNGTKLGVYSVWEWDMNTHSFAEGNGQGRVQRAWLAEGRVTDEKGFNTLDGKYLVATTSMFGEIGEWVTFYFDNGVKIETIKVDAKAEAECDWDHNPANKYGHNNGANILEFCGVVNGSVDGKLGTVGARVVKAVRHGVVV